MERGWALNIGGGFHHCHSENGGGFCAYADITLCIRFLFELNSSVKTAMIVDLDAHQVSERMLTCLGIFFNHFRFQGNGHERDFMGDDNVYIMDVYNRGIYPGDHQAKKAIRQKVELSHYTPDDLYLDLVKT